MAKAENKLKDGKNIILRKNKTKKVVTYSSKPSMTDQSQKDATDASKVVRQFIKTGLITHINHIEGQYTDVSEVNDLYENMTKVKQVQRYFMDLPSDIRKKFDNDPQKMLEFVVDPAMEQEQIDLGLKPDPSKPKEEQKDVKDSGGSETPTENH